jgi:hypothetical protein
VVRATSAGRKAQEVWRPLFGFVEKRWEARLGKHQLDQLRASLWALVSQLDVDLPDCLPILGYGLFSKVHRQEPGTPAGRERDNRFHLPLLQADRLQRRRAWH